MKKIYFLLLVFSIHIYAHQLKENYLQVDLNTTTQLLTINLEVETRLLEDNTILDDNKNEIISFKELYAHQEYLLLYIKKHFQLYYQNEELTFTDAKITFHRYQDQTYMQINKSFNNIRLDGLSLKYDMFFDLEPMHKLLLHLGADRGDIILDNTKRSYSFTSGKISQLERFYLFVKEGISHILDGLDHLLFILMMLIPSAVLLSTIHSSPQFKKSAYSLLKIITTFSVAHSLTLFIAGIGWWIPNIIVTESSIAFSIVVVALLNFLGKYEHVNKKIVFLFGLLHGFGFANVLEIAQVNDTLSFLNALLGFNLGVEIGQIFVILFIIPFLYFSSKSKYYLLAIKLMSFIAVCVSSFWFLQRIGFI